MIVLTNVTARGEATRRGVGAMLRGVSATLGRGVSAIVGAPGDGTSALLAVVAGIVRARSGSVTVLGKPPDEARADVAHVPLDPLLPDALRVEELCDLAATIRGESARPPTERLAALGLEMLAKRRVRSLSVGEARAVSLAIAIASRAPVLLVEEPLAMLEPTAPGRVVEALRARAAAGATVVVTTASVRDATQIADELSVLTAGVLTPLPAALALAGAGGRSGGDVRLRVVVPPRADGSRGTAALVAALAEDPRVSSVESQSFAAAPADPAGARVASAVVVGGRELLAVAGAVALAAAAARVDLEAIETAVAPLDAIRERLAPPRAPAASPPASVSACSAAPSLERPTTPVMPSRPPGSVPPRGAP